MTSDNNEERVETTEQSIPVSGVEVPETNDDAVAEEDLPTEVVEPASHPDEERGSRE